jgi:hypothetical protein
MNTHVRERESHAPRLFIEVTPELRRVLAEVAEAAVDALDQIDGDPDLEDDGPAQPDDDADLASHREPTGGAP